MKILLIKDEYQEEKDLISGYEKSFIMNHFEVKIASRLDLDIEKIKKEKPDFILMLFLFPYPTFSPEKLQRLNSPRIKFLEELKEDKETKDIPIFVLGNYDLQEIKEMNLKLDKYILILDYTPSQIVEMIRKFKEER
ncbi:MAG: hypothetical protein QME57_03865 [Patescibacteria group bacterium]|nr:hypothetical protein [Patescibacteria group bacterium]